MQDTLSSNSTAIKPLRRRPGPIGGVLAAVAHKTDINANLLRFGTIVAGTFAGPLVVVAYLAAWLLMPVDTSYPVSEQPGPAPKAVLGVVAAVVAIQVLFGLITSLPFTWIAVAVIAAYWFFFRD